MYGSTMCAVTGVLLLSSTLRRMQAFGQESRNSLEGAAAASSAGGGTESSAAMDFLAFLAFFGFTPVICTASTRADFVRFTNASDGGTSSVF